MTVYSLKTAYQISVYANDLIFTACAFFDRNWNFHSRHYMSYGQITAIPALCRGFSRICFVEVRKYCCADI